VTAISFLARVADVEPPAGSYDLATRHATVVRGYGFRDGSHGDEQRTGSGGPALIASGQLNGNDVPAWVRDDL
jgi:hypothetical protein